MDVADARSTTRFFTHMVLSDVEGATVMLIIRQSRGYLPKYNSDLPMFRHCCEGMIEVKDINFWLPVFEAHSIQIMIQDETHDS